MPHPDGQPRQFLKQGHAQHQGEGPKFGDIEGVLRLIGLEARRQLILRDNAARTADDLHGQVVNAQLAGPPQQRGKNSGVMPRQIGPHLSEVALKNVGIVDQPGR